MRISNRSQDGEQFLEEGPVAPCFQYHIEVLSRFGIGKIEGTEEGGCCRNDRIEEVNWAVESGHLSGMKQLANLSLRGRERPVIELWFRFTEPRIGEETSALEVVRQA